jgi:site-specific recombinase XerD
MMDVSEAVEGYLLFKATHASPRTMKTDTVLFRQFCKWLGDCPLGKVTSDHVRRYLDYQIKRGLSPYTIRRHHAVLSALYGWLTSPDIALADSNPVSNVSPPKLPKRKVKALDKENIEALLDAADHSLCKRRARALVLFLLESGARGSEVTGVALEHVT